MLKFQDIYHRLRTEPALRKELNSIFGTLYEAEKSGMSNAELVQKSITRVMQLCNYNVGVLFPYVFPAYIQGDPLSLLHRPFGFAMSDISPGSVITTRAGRQAAKSTTIGAKLLTCAHMFPWRQMYIAPHHDQLKTFARRLRELERSCRFKVVASKYKQNDFYKEYATGSVVELYNVYTDAVGIRGKTTDFITIDEAQSFDGSLLPEVHQVMKATKWPVFNVSGTSLTIDTFLEEYYQNGSRGTWHIPCPGTDRHGNRRYLDCGNKDQILGAIKEGGLCCPWTGRRLDPRTGFFVHEYNTRVEKGQVSLHVPQVIIPDYTLDLSKWDEIWQAYLNYDHKKFLQEVMGIPTELGARELTEKELQDICTLGSMDEAQARIKKPGYYKFIISGCDWGGSDYNRALNTKESYTVHAVVGCTHDGKFDILHLRDYSGMGYQEVAHDIVVDHRRFRGDMLGSDFGVGAAYNMLLRGEGGVNPNKHLVFSYSGVKSSPVSVPKGDHMFNQYSLNKTESITELFKAIKNGRIRCYDWEQSKNLLGNFLNIMRVQHESETTGGATLRFIRAGNKPDDAAHAVNFAFVLGRLALGEPLIGDHEDAQRLREMIHGGRGVSSVFSVPDPISG